MDEKIVFILSQNISLSTRNIAALLLLRKPEKKELACVYRVLKQLEGKKKIRKLKLWGVWTLELPT